MEASERSRSLHKIDLNCSSAIEQIRAACGHDGPGFFYLKMNPDENRIADQVLKSSQDFFSLEMKHKLSIQNGIKEFYRYKGFKIPASGPGYRPPGGDVNFSKDSRESYNIGRDVSVMNDPPYGPTPWPSEDLVPNFREINEMYSRILCNRCEQLRSAIAQALDLPENYFDKPGLFDEASWLLGMVHYFPIESDVKNRTFGIAPHQDDGFVTFLYTDGKPGLQMCPEWKTSGFHRDEQMHNPNLKWVDVDFVPGHWIVNLGTFLSKWTRGRFKATLHRVVITSNSEHRFSLPFFYEPNIDCNLKCVPTCEHWRSNLPTSSNVITPGDTYLEMAKRDGVTLIREKLDAKL